MKGWTSVSTVEAKDVFVPRNGPVVLWGITFCLLCCQRVTDDGLSNMRNKGRFILRREGSRGQSCHTYTASPTDSFRYQTEHRHGSYQPDDAKISIPLYGLAVRGFHWYVCSHIDTADRLAFHRFGRTMRLFTHITILLLLFLLLRLQWKRKVVQDGSIDQGRVAL